MEIKETSMLDEILSSAQERQAYADWLKARPPIIQKIGSTIKPWRAYALHNHKDYYTLYSINEDGTVKLHRWNRKNHDPVHLVVGQPFQDLYPHPDEEKILMEMIEKQ